MGDIVDSKAFLRCVIHRLAASATVRALLNEIVPLNGKQWYALLHHARLWECLEQERILWAVVPVSRSVIAQYARDVSRALVSRILIDNLPSVDAYPACQTRMMDAVAGIVHEAFDAWGDGKKRKRNVDVTQSVRRVRPRLLS
jgi:hypothetical protein